jgi:hypothetical protein
MTGERAALSNVSDDPFYLPNYRPPPRPTVRQPVELLWEFRKDHHTYACDLKTD